MKPSPARFLVAAPVALAAAALCLTGCAAAIGARAGLSDRAEALGKRQLALIEQLRVRADALQAAPQTPETAARFQESKTLALAVWAVGQATKAASRCGNAEELAELEDATMRLAQRIGDE
ncbi:MAG: hypothetical protein HMLKMBBP_00369 [Planctomycetes bacterium]|nr:hypothetical protein [Planctomycetota bacterium]